MNDQTTTAGQEIVVFRDGMTKMRGQLETVLPKHIPYERFERVVVTAVQNNPDLLMRCDRKSLWNACMRAAQDGLLPDGRYGAIVPYKGHAQWMPMVMGIRQKARNSGEILDWDVQLVYANDHFECDLGTSKKIIHQPFMGEGDRGQIRCCYSIANLKDGGQSIELMSISEVEKIKAQSSRAKDGPWQVQAFYPEMVRKTVARRHSKSLPMSSDLDDLIRADDNLYELPEKHEGQQPRAHRLGRALDALAAPEVSDSGNGDAETDAKAEADNEAKEAAGARAQAENKAVNESADTKPADAKAEGAKPAEPAKAEADGVKTVKPAAVKLPASEAEYRIYAKGWIDAGDTAGAADLRSRWTSMEEKTLRNRCQVSPDSREQIFEYLLGRKAA